MVVCQWNWVHANHPGPRPMEGGEPYEWDQWHGIIFAWFLPHGSYLSLDLGWKLITFEV